MAVVAAATPFSNVLASIDVGSKTKKYPISFFTKPLDEYDPEFMAEALAMAGLDGFDLSVRPGGIVEPERVSIELPRIVELGKKHNLLTEMMVTAIKDTTDPYAENVIEVASKNGIKHYRLGYYDYDYKKGIIESLADVRSKMERLARLNQKFSIQAGYQNHSGTRVGAPMWDVWELIRNISPKLISSQFDVRHAVTEGNASWIVSMHLLNKNIGSLALKDFTWGVSGKNAKVVSVPLGEGLVDFELFFKTIKEMNIVTPLTLHVEYPLLGKEDEKLSLIQKQRLIVSKLKKDVDFIRLNLVKYELI